MIKKLDIDLLEDATEEKYKKELNDHILEWTKAKYSRDRAIAEWDTKYPEGFDTWKGRRVELSAVGEQHLIDKINEIIDYLNEQDGNPELLQEILESKI